MVNRESTDSGQLCSPPKPPLVFRIGVVGHRPNRLQGADLTILQTRIGEIVLAVQTQVVEHHATHRDFYDECQPIVRAISPLAEGVDRLFARASLAAGCKLTAVLPFIRDEFQQDFAPGKGLEEDSLSTFNELLSQATTIFEMDGFREDESRAYHVAGDVVLNQSDLLIVVWDGERQNLRGGTEQTFDDAIERGVPIVWIDAHAPHHLKLVTKPLHSSGNIKPGVGAEISTPDDLVGVKQQVDRLLSLTRPNSSPGKSHSTATDPLHQLQTFYRERQPAWHLGIFWQWFRDFMGQGHLIPPSPQIEPYESQLVRKGGEWPQCLDNPVAALVDTLRPYYAWADRSANLYADAYRSAFVTSYFLAAIAVAMALGGVGLHLQPHSIGELIFAGLELLMIGTILILVFRGRRADWHRRWLDYRLLAEMIRHQRLVAPLGGQRATPQVPEHLVSYGDPGASWMAWYSRALERSIGLPTAVVDPGYLRRSVADQLSILQSQIRFHEKTHHRSERIEHKLHIVEVLFLAATLVCCLQHIAQGLWHDWPQFPGHVLTFFCGVFPALGTAMAGISNQGEFRRVAQRSKSIHERLKEEVEELQSLQLQLNSPTCAMQRSPEIALTATTAAQTMVNEVLDWRVIFQDRPLRTA